MAQDDLNILEKEIEAFEISDEASLEAFKNKFIGKKSVLNALFGKMKDIPNDEKKVFGASVNILRDKADEKFREGIASLEEKNAHMDDPFDYTLPVVPYQTGSRHPLSIVENRMVTIFERLGFNVSEGPEIEDDWHNFSALNFPPEHPAREMQDTFFVEKDPDVMLRTHTSSVQIRLMQSEGAPVKSIMPGRVYRNEAISARAHCFFHQVEGLHVDKNVSFMDLKDTLYYFASEMFGKEVEIRFRPSYFPFTEPSAEIDISCFICEGEGCRVCKHSGWVEIGGSGMVHPNVLRNCSIDPEEYTGFAFGMGVERITMLKYGINDLRLFSENDVRFLRQFRGL